MSDKRKLPEGRDAHIVTHDGAEHVTAFSSAEIELIEALVSTPTEAALLEALKECSDVLDLIGMGEEVAPHRRARAIIDARSAIQLAGG